MFNPVQDLKALANPQFWVMFSTELAKASPILVPIYYSVFDWINAHHHDTRPLAGTFYSLLALDLTLMVFCVYQLVKPWLPRKTSRRERGRRFA